MTPPTSGLALTRSSPLCLALLLSITSAVFAADPAPGAPRAALEKWFAAAAKIRTIQAEFDQLRKLRSVRNPLRKPGRMWLEKEGGLFRWQVGEPPELLAIRSKDGVMTVLDSKQKIARIWSREALETEEQQGRGQGFAMLSAMQNASLADFDRDFILADGKADAANPALWHFEWKFKDSKVGLFVLRLAIVANTGDGSLQSLTLHMRDGSHLGTVVRSYKLNAAIPAAVFEADTAGYSIETVAPKS